ncbi:MAG: phosphoribosylformylglycinamidine cyclo-ligase [Eubacteriaceae bacterium]|nr:phosphoribosylformylglycinamidine cyclo-ligase [Eubacteriaceae bacterium]
MVKDSRSKSYEQAGVDVTAGYKAVELMKEHISKTRTPGVLDEVGGFSGMFKPDFKGLKEPVLVSGTDGVGTKLMLAFLLDKHDTVGIDCVAMSVNDVICCGAKPIFFLDYIACGKNTPEKIALIVKGVSEGCVQAGCALIGGETAEMPGFYPPDEYDLAGFAVGLADKAALPDKTTIAPGDAIIGLSSSGVHSNGFSLIRKIFGITSKTSEVSRDILEELLTPTVIYVKPILALMEQVKVKSISHITGGGFYENIPRSLPRGVSAVIDRAAWQVPDIFREIQRAGSVPERDMFNTFNMGIGMSAVVPAESADRAVEILTSCGVKAAVIGQTGEGEGVTM